MVWSLQGIWHSLQWQSILQSMDPSLERSRGANRSGSVLVDLGQTHPELALDIYYYDPQSYKLTGWTRFCPLVGSDLNGTITDVTMNSRFKWEVNKDFNSIIQQLHFNSMEIKSPMDQQWTISNASRWSACSPQWEKAWSPQVHKETIVLKQQWIEQCRK